MFWDKLDKNVKFTLPKDYYFKNLETRHHTLVHKLLRDHSSDLVEGFLTKIYHEDYYYWFLKMNNPELSLGLIYEDVLIGVLLVNLIQYQLNGNNYWIANGWQFCIQRFYRKTGLAVSMMFEMKNRLKKYSIDKFMFPNDRQKVNHCYQLSLINIPVNFTRLLELELIDDEDHKILKNNSVLNIAELHLMKSKDVEEVTKKLNQFNECYNAAPLMNHKLVEDFLLPKKNIIYTFVKYTNEEITDMISFYQHQLIFQESGDFITVAQLGLYFVATVSLDILISSARNKLKHYGFDQISYYEYGQLSQLKLTTFETDVKCFFSLHGLENITDFNGFTFIPI